MGENHSQLFARSEECCDVIRSIMRPGQQEKPTAALTLASLLALANVGELSVQQAEPFSASMKLDALRVSSYLRGVQDGKALLVHIGPAQRASECITWYAKRCLEEFQMRWREEKTREAKTGSSWCVQEWGNPKIHPFECCRYPAFLDRVECDCRSFGLLFSTTLNCSIAGDALPPRKVKRNMLR